MKLYRTSVRTILLIIVISQSVNGTTSAAPTAADIESIFHCNSTISDSDRNRDNVTEESVLVDIPRSVYLGNFDIANNDNRSRVYIRVEGALDCELENNRTGFIPRYLNETRWPKLKTHFVSRNGSLRFKGEDYSTQEFCTDEVTDTLVSIRFCKPEKDEFQDAVNRNSPAIRKCCPSGQVYDLSEYARGNIFCVPGSQNDSSLRTLEDSVILYGEESGVKADSKRNASETGVEFVPNGKGWCKSGGQKRKLYTQRELIREKPFLFRMTVNGTVLVKEKLGQWISLPPGLFCMELATNFHMSRYEIKAANKDKNDNESPADDMDLVILLCNSAQSKENEIEKNVYKSTNPPFWITETYGLFQGIACFFLILIVVVHLALWDKQNVHSWTLLCSALSMTMWYLSTLITHYYNYKSPITGKNNDEDDLFCMCLAVTTHFFLLSTFSWITLINFDIWSTFTNLKMISRSKSFQWRRFAAYSLFALGVPVIVVTIGLILDNLYKNDVESTVVTPNYGGLKCYMSIEKASLQYIYSPVAILMITNLLFFFSTIRTLYNVRQSTKVATTSVIRRRSIANSDKKSMLLFTKLFFVMGVVWSFELGVFFVYLNNPTHPLVYIADLIHSLQPVAVFIIFVCKKDVLKGLEQKYPSFKKILRVCTRCKLMGEGGGVEGGGGGSKGSSDTTGSSVYLSSSTSSRSMSITSFTSFKFQPWKKSGKGKSGCEDKLQQESSIENVQPQDVQV